MNSTPSIDFWSNALDSYCEDNMDQNICMEYMFKDVFTFYDVGYAIDLSGDPSSAMLG